MPDGTEQSLVRITRSLHPILLIPVGRDSLTTAEDNALWANVKSQEDIKIDLEQLQEDELFGETASFQASVASFPFIAVNWEKKIVGDVGVFRYEITPPETNGDVQIYLTKKKGHVSKDQKADWKKFSAFIEALEFIHGTHIWPYRIEYWRAGKKITDRVNELTEVARTKHIPFPERLTFNARTGSLAWSYQETVQKITAFFETESMLSKEVSELLFLFREAARKGVHSEITTLAFCVLFEKLFQLIFDELKLEEKATLSDPDISAFEKAKTRLLRFLERLSNRHKCFLRLLKIIQPASAFSARERLKAVVLHFGLKWEGDMEEVFKTWNKSRNLLVHRKRHSTRTEDEQKSDILLESRIAGGFNILVLKLFGYSGMMSVSLYESKYRNV